MIAAAGAGLRPRAGAGIATWIACIALAVAVLFAPFAGLGVAPRTLGATLAFGVLFIGLPGLALLARTPWMDANPLAFAGWCGATGVAAMPLWLTPLWMAGALGFAWVVPCASAALIAMRRASIARYVRDAMAPHGAREWLGATAAPCAFIAVTACLGVMHPFATTPIDPHFGTQGSIVRNLADGWPPMNQLLEGVPLSYNYGVHLALMLLVDAGGADLVQLVSRVAPLVFLEAAIAAFILFGRTVLRLRWTALIAGAVAAFWVVGFGPVNSALYGAVLPSASTYVVSSSAGFVVFFVALRFLAGPRSVRPAAAAAIAAALAFSIAAMRGQGGPVWIAVTAFACALELRRYRRVAAGTLAVLGGSIAGLLVALRIFFTLGSGFSGTSFLHIGTTFGWLAQQHAFTVVEALQRHGVNAWTAGAAGFVVIALMQSKFLAPAFVYRVATLRRDAPDAALLLAATALAGTAATMLTSAPGGSHFSFMHYGSLAMALLGAMGLALLLDAPARPALRIVTLALVAALSIPSAWDLVVQLRRFQGRWLAGPPVVHALSEVDPLLDRIPPEAMALPLLRAADQVPGIEAEWGMRRGLRFALYSSLLHEYASWHNALQPELRHRVAATVAIEHSLLGGRLRAADLEAVVRTLSRPQPLYVIAPASAVPDADPRLRAIASTKAYTLYFFKPEGLPGP